MRATPRNQRAPMADSHKSGARSLKRQRTPDYVLPALHRLGPALGFMWPILGILTSHAVRETRSLWSLGLMLNTKFIASCTCTIDTRVLERGT